METTIDTDEDVRATPRRSMRIALRSASVALVAAGSIALADGLAQMWSRGITARYLLTIGGGDPRQPADALPQFLQLINLNEDVLYLEDLPLGVRLLCMSPALVAGSTAFVASLFVVRLVRAVARGDAFGRRPRRALGVAGITCLAGGLLQGLLDTAAVARLVALTGQSLDADGTMLSDVYRVVSLEVPHWPVQTILVGAVGCILLLAFRAGAELQEEAAGVV
ncbi:hypothetical protein [Sanguibacter sp. 25GB23B1]|uniref:hypothetical protein n=1 Tax=unclassified Sanguibacter TaxID=2645534 RepID=UPI0032AEBDBB